MEKELEQRIKDMKQSAEKVQLLKKENERTMKKEASQTAKKTPAAAKQAKSAASCAEKKERTSLAWNSRVKCELPYYLL